MTFADWNIISEGTDPGVIVVIDYESGRSDPGFAELAPLVRLPWTMVQPVPPLISAADGAVHYLQSWVDQLAGSDVRAVFGYCAGGALACALAAELGRGGAKPSVLLVDPSAAHGWLFLHQFTEATQQFDGVVDAVVLADAARSARAVCSDPALAQVSELTRLYRQLASDALDDLDYEEVVDELCDQFDSYVHYLLAARWLGYSDSADSTVAVFSADYAEPEGYIGQVVKIDVPHAALMTDPGLCDAVRHLFANPAAG